MAAGARARARPRPRPRPLTTIASWGLLVALFLLLSHSSCCHARSTSPAPAASGLAAEGNGTRRRRSAGGIVVGRGGELTRELNLRGGCWNLLPLRRGPTPFKRVLILMSDTGGGHRASAEALSAAFHSLYPGQVHTHIVDVWTDYAGWPFNRIVKMYSWMGKRYWVWRLGFHYGRFPLTIKASAEWSCLVSIKGFMRCMEEYDPDLVVSVHPLCQDLPQRALRRLGGGKRKVPFVTVVTDLASAHPTWFDRKADATYVPSLALLKRALRAGLSPGRIRLVGLPLRKQFWNPNRPRKRAARRHLGIKQGIPAVMIVGGGEGVGRIFDIATETAESLGKDLHESSLIIVCGKNHAAAESLRARNWPSNVHVTVYGFSSEFAVLLSAVDLMVTKAGPGTIAEACTRGLPLILSSFLPGQEHGNVAFAQDGGFGIFTRCPKGIADTASALLRDPQR
jgi:1,2-diacylglycerol 3-beta-galactosyltransferase